MEKLEFIAKRKTQNKAAEAAFVCGEAKKIVAKILNDSKAIKSISLSSGNLKISVLGPACAQEVTLFEEGIIEAINEKVGEGVVKKVSVRI